MGLGNRKETPPHIQTYNARMAFMNPKSLTSVLRTQPGRDPSVILSMEALAYITTRS